MNTHTTAERKGDSGPMVYDLFHRDLAWISFGREHDKLYMDAGRPLPSLSGHSDQIIHEAALIHPDSQAPVDFPAYAMAVQRQSEHQAQHGNPRPTHQDIGGIDKPILITSSPYTRKRVRTPESSPPPDTPTPKSRPFVRVTEAGKPGCMQMQLMRPEKTPNMPPPPGPDSNRCAQHSTPIEQHAAVRTTQDAVRISGTGAHHTSKPVPESYTKSAITHKAPTVAATTSNASYRPKPKNGLAALLASKKPRQSAAISRNGGSRTAVQTTTITAKNAAPSAPTKATCRINDNAPSKPIGLGNKTTTITATKASPSAPTKATGRINHNAPPKTTGLGNKTTTITAKKAAPSAPTKATGRINDNAPPKPTGLGNTPHPSRQVVGPIDPSNKYVGIDQGVFELFNPSRRR